MRVVIIGGAGFLGTSIAQTLIKQGDDVQIYDTSYRFSRVARRIPEAELVPFNFLDVGGNSRLFEGIDAIIHLACTTNPARSMEAMCFDAETNIISSLRVFEAAEKAGVQQVVFASSGGTVYGIPNELPVNESHSTLPICAYGVSKLAIENYLSLYSARGIIKGINLRVSNPYGAYQLQGGSVGLIAHYLKNLFEQKTIEVWGDGSVIRDYIHISDVASAFSLALKTDGLASGTYNISSNTGKSINEIIDIIFKQTGKSVEVNYLPSRAFDVPRIVLDNELFKKGTGWEESMEIVSGVEGIWREMA